MGNLSNLYISQSFTSLAHLGTNNALVPGTMTQLEDGIGQSLNISFDGTNISSSGNIFAANITASVVNTGSLVTTSSFNAYTSSNNQRVSSLEAATASYVTETESGSFLLTASFDNGTRNLTFTKGNNTTFAVNIPDISGSTLPSGVISGSAQITALGFVSSSITASSLITASASGNTITFTKGNSSTFSVSVDTGSAATTIFEVVYTGENITKGDPLYISGSQGANPRVFKADAAVAAKMPVTFVSNETIGASNTTNAIVLGLIEGIDLTGYTAGQSIYVAEGGGWSASLPSGSNSVTQLLGVVTKGGSGGKGLVLNPGPAQLPGLDTGKMWVGNGNNQPIEITTASFVNTASFNSYTSSTNSRLTNIESTTASLNNSVSNLNTATASLFTSTSLSLTTASFAGNTLTFTKGNGTTFGVVIPDVSGSTINTGSFATTGSNTFVGNQIVSGGVDIATNNTLQLGDLQFGSVYKGIKLATDASGNPSVNIYGTASAELHIGAVQSDLSSLNDLFIFADANNIQFQTINTGFSYEPFLTVDNIPSASPLFNKGLIVTGSTNIQNLTASLQQGYVWVGDTNGKTTTVSTSSFGGGSVNTGSLMVTGSISGNTLTFTKGDASTFNLIIPSASGSVFDTGSFATTGSNTFTGTQTIATGNLVMGNGFNINAPSGAITNLSAANTIQFITEGAAGPGGTNDIKFINRVSGSKIIFENTQGGQGNGIEFTAGAALFNIAALSGSTGKVTFGSNTTAIEALSTPILAQRLQLSGPLTASLQQGYVWAGGVGDVSTLVATSSFTINTGSFATTGSNTFRGDQTLLDNSGNYFTIVNASGSMMLVGETMTSSSLHISSSAVAVGSGAVNLIFKVNNLTSDTIISGSNNIFQNPNTPTAGFKRYLTSNNIALGAGFPQISGSMAFSPSISNNYFGQGALTIRGPVSSSAWSISTNNIQGTVNIGTGVTTNAERLVSGLTMTTNVIPGTLSIIANGTPLSSSMTINANYIAGATSISAASSSVNMLNNIINDAGFVLTNNSFSSSVGLSAIAVNRNNIAGQGNQIIVAGGIPAGTTTAQSLSDNFIGGGANIIYGDIANARVSGSTAYHHAIRNMVFGNGLIITGSSLLTDVSSFGSAFIGRYNSTDGNKDLTNETIFAVGTGNATTRKTGFLIDSGSNTFVEGTLNVSGSSSFTGAVNITGSLLVNGVAPITTSSSFALVDGNNTFTAQNIFNNQVKFGTSTPSDSFSDITFANNQSLQIATKSTLLGGQTGSFQVMSMTTGSGGIASFQMTAQISGTIGQLRVRNDAGVTNVAGFADNILFAKNEGFPNTPSTTFTTEATSINLRGNVDVSGSTNIIGNTNITGSLILSSSAAVELTVVGASIFTGSVRGNVVPLSITSNTASMDLNLGNYFTLTLANTATTHITATNIQPGTSATLVITTGTNSSASLAPTLLEPSGSDYVATNGSAKKDVLSFVAVDSTNMFVVSTKNMI